MARRGLISSTALLVALAGPLCAQPTFTVNGCPNGPTSTVINGFTAGTSSDSQICLFGTFGASTVYDVTLTDTDTGQQTTVVGTASTTMLIVTVPASFYAAVQTPGVPDPVTLRATIPQVLGSGQTGAYQINPPLTSGGLVLLGTVNQPVTWQITTGGTGPWTEQMIDGTAPTGMEPFPAAGQTWSGTPTQTGTFDFYVTAGDAWGNTITESLAAYIVPQPGLKSLSVTSATVGNPGFTLTISGEGFVSPQTIVVGGGPIRFLPSPRGGSLPEVNEPGSIVYWTNGTNTVQLTPLSYALSTLTVALPASLFLTTGVVSVTVVNPGGAVSNAEFFRINPAITTLSTYTHTAGAPPGAVTVTGLGFLPSSMVQLNGVSIPTTYQSPTSLTATFPSMSAPVTESVTVLNPDTTVTPGVSFVYVPAPTASALVPASAVAGSATFGLTVMGSNLTQGMTVYFNSVPLSTTLNPVTYYLVATVPASAVVNAGTVPVTVGTVDGYFTPPLSFSIVGPLLQLLTLSPLPAGAVNSPYTFTFTASQGAGGYVFSVLSGTLPAGLQLSPTGVLSGTPTAYGSSQFTVQVADSAHATVSRQFTLNIVPAPLMLTTGPLSNTQINTPVSVQFAGTGGIPPYTFVEFGALPPGVAISSAGLLSGTPTKTGGFPFRVFIDDSTGASASGTFTLYVALPGLLITPPSPLPPGEINVPYTTTLAATGGIGPPYIWSATGLPNGLTIASTTGLIAGIPRASGTFTVAVTLGDYSGATVTQNYGLTIASATVTVTGPPLPNGAVGSSYTAVVTGSGGSGTLTFTASGLPAGLTISPAGVVSGTPTTAGPSSVTVTATDATGATGNATYRVTITAPLTVTAAQIPNAVVGTAIAPVTFTASGGTPPYQWQSASAPAGLSLALNGTLSGTPTAAGTFSFPVFAVDSNGVLASGTQHITVNLPAAPAATISGLPPTTAPTTQPAAQVSLANPFPVPVTANLTLTFAPTSGADDPAIQFSSGGRMAQILIPAGSTAGLTNVGVQTGTVAGTITITAQLFAGTTNVTPTPAPTATLVVTAGAPVITKVTAVRSGSGFTVNVTGFASTRDVDSATFTFSPSEGSNLQTTSLNTTDTSLFTTWYTNSASAQFGSEFTLSQTFSVNGNASSVQSVTVTLTNALGTSTTAAATLQ